MLQSLSNWTLSYLIPPRFIYLLLSDWWEPLLCIITWGVTLKSFYLICVLSGNTLFLVSNSWKGRNAIILCGSYTTWAHQWHKSLPLTFHGPTLVLWTCSTLRVAVKRSKRKIQWALLHLLYFCMTPKILQFLNTWWGVHIFTHYHTCWKNLLEFTVADAS